MIVHTPQTIDTETLSRELTELDRLLHRIRERIQPAHVRSRTKQDDVREVWKRTAGVLKNKITEDPVEWQRRIRAEWE
ncbi:MAG: hypothetical protein Q7S48_04540 [bacterium]|nr:hypothetical protein [bacterium]